MTLTIKGAFLEIESFGFDLFLYKIKAKRPAFSPILYILNLQNYCQKAGVNYESPS